MADTVQRQELNMVLIVRNDKTTVWQNSTYKLEKGITADRHGMIIIRNEGILDILNK